MRVWLFKVLREKKKEKKKRMKSTVVALRGSTLEQAGILPWKFFILSSGATPKIIFSGGSTGQLFNVFEQKGENIPCLHCCPLLAFVIWHRFSEIFESGFFSL